MIIAIDIDDVICNLVEQWVKEYNFDFQDNLTLDKITEWDISKFVKKECGKKIFRYIEDPTIYERVTIKKNTISAINKIKNNFDRVIFITASTVGAAGRKFSLLKEYNLIDDKKDYFECHDKSLINYSLLIDDRYDNVINNRENNILFNAPWNLKYDFKRRANDWSEILEMLGL